MNISKQKSGVIFLFIILLIIASVGTFVAMSLRVDPVEESLKSDPVIYTLWVITDDDGNALSTALMFFYPSASRGLYFDILGNTGAIYKSLNRVDRIDAVYKEKGIDVYRQEIESLVDKKIPFSIEISLSDFSTLTDYLGGLNIFVPFPVDEKTENGDLYLLPSGAVRLDGEKIRTFLTYRLEAETDSDVNGRREAVFVAFLSALKENRNKILSKNNFARYAATLKSNIEEDNLKSLLEKVTDIDAERLTAQPITGTLRSVEGKTLLFPYYDGQLIKDVVNQGATSLVSGEITSANRVYVLVIKNGTSQQGLARNTSFLMASAGYEILEAVNADRNDYTKTQIINHIGNEEAAKALGSFIRCTNIVNDQVLPENAGADSAAKADFTIILGRDFDGRYVK